MSGTVEDECWECGEKLRNQDLAEIVLKRDIERLPNDVHQSYLIHAHCFDPTKHEVA